VNSLLGGIFLCGVMVGGLKCGGSLSIVPVGLTTSVSRKILVSKWILSSSKDFTNV
jgi:hypothetical protein